ncbi:MAG: aminotransferase class III-fold pyridoxal phosphate-dependent enzyme, partial [Mesorhizobium sp.]
MILMLSDEVVCGFGGTGNWFGSQTFGMEPD